MAQQQKQPTIWLRSHVDNRKINELNYNICNNYYIKDNINITIPLAYVISNFSPSDSDALGIIAPSGSNKTELLRIFGEEADDYTYPVSSITGRTLVSGNENNKDLAPRLKGRVLVIKDFTTILSKSKNELPIIFACFRDMLDGYVTYEYGNGIEPKTYRGLHSSILFACTNAIEQQYTLHSVMGNRIIYFRPQSDVSLSRQKAMHNAGSETKIRKLLQPQIKEFIKDILEHQKTRILNLTHGVPKDMQDRIGDLCEFMELVRAPIPRTGRGEQAGLPEPASPVRSTKTLCKIVDAHSILYERLPNKDDEKVAMRLVHDNIPTTRKKILSVLIANKHLMTTSEVAITAKISSPLALSNLDDLTTLEIIEKSPNGVGKGYSWEFPNNKYRKAFLSVLNP